MATAAKTVDDAVVVLPLSPQDILIGDRLGAFWPDKAAALGQMMAEDGQIVPIIVRKSGPRSAAKWTLVAGHHRLEGAKMAGLAVIDAIEIEAGADALKIEAMENAARPERSPLERASFVRAIADAAEARLKDQHGDLSPQEVGIRKRWDAVKGKAAGVERDETLNEAEADHTSANIARLYGWAEATAEAMGMSKRALFLDLALHRALIAPFPGLWRDLATHPKVGENASALREIASYQSLDARRAIIETLIQHPDMDAAAAAIAAGVKDRDASTPATGATKFQNGVIKNLHRLTAEQQRSIASSFAKTIKPSIRRDFIAALVALDDAEGGAA